MICEVGRSRDGPFDQLDANTAFGQGEADEISRPELDQRSFGQVERGGQVMPVLDEQLVDRLFVIQLVEGRFAGNRGKGHQIGLDGDRVRLDFLRRQPMREHPTQQDAIQCDVGRRPGDGDLGNERDLAVDQVVQIILGDGDPVRRALSGQCRA